MTDTIDMDDVETAELAVYEPSTPDALTLFGTSDPRLALTRMSEVATLLMDVIDSKRLYKVIRGRKFIFVEGWTTLGGMLGVVAIVTGTRPNEVGDGFIAHVEARRLDGTVVGGAEGECSRAESKWKDRDPYALRAMAQTRAISRALRGPLGQIVILAGYETAGAEEVDEAAPPLRDDPGGDGDATGPATRRAIPSEGILPPAVRPTAEQLQQIKTLLADLTALVPATDWAAEARHQLGVQDARYMTRTMADQLLHEFGQRRDLLADLKASLDAAEEADDPE